VVRHLNHLKMCELWCYWYNLLWSSSNKTICISKAESVIDSLFKGYGLGDRVSVPVRAGENFSFAWMLTSQKQNKKKMTYTKILEVASDTPLPFFDNCWPFNRSFYNIHFHIRQWIEIVRRGDTVTYFMRLRRRFLMV